MPSAQVAIHKWVNKHSLAGNEVPATMEEAMIHMSHDPTASADSRIMRVLQRKMMRRGGY